jgi:pyruvate dehydrogenase E2 component (dihydrolipoamide acetyltransferase)
MSAITPIKMPKWGLSMIEGKIVAWHKAEGEVVKEGEDLVDVETSKITNVAEAPSAGTLRRILAQPDETLPVGALIAVLAEPHVPDADIVAFVADFQSQFVPSEEDDGADGPPQRFVSANGVTVKVGVYAEDKNATPVVLIHGYSADMNNWLFLAPALAVSRPVYALDLPGHGGSDKTVGDGSIAFLAQTVEKAMAELGVHKAHIVGHSMGGAVAMQLALTAPDRVQSVSLLASAALPGGIINRDFLDGMATGMRAKDIKHYLEMIFATPEIVTKDMVDAMVKYKRLDGVEQALSTLAATLGDGVQAQALIAHLPKIPRALVIASRHDRIVGAPDPALFPAGWTTVFLDQTGHMPHLEAAPAVLAALAEHMG